MFHFASVTFEESANDFSSLILKVVKVDRKNVAWQQSFPTTNAVMN
jgi:hypothetical protein